MQEIVSKATCLAFREFLSANATLRKIEVAFSSGNVTPVAHAIEAGGRAQIAGREMPRTMNREIPARLQVSTRAAASTLPNSILPCIESFRNRNL